MHTITRRIITAAAVLAAGTGITLAVSAPAHAASTGTISYAESQTLVKQLKKQHCVTAKESRAIVHGQGHVTRYRYTDISWKGTRNDIHTEGRVTLIHGCVKNVMLDYGYGEGDNWTKQSNGRVTHYWA